MKLSEKEKISVKIYLKLVSYRNNKIAHCFGNFGNCFASGSEAIINDKECKLCRIMYERNKQKN